MSKVVKSFRIEQDVIEEAEQLDLNLNDIVRAAIAKAVKEKKCPYCRAKLKSLIVAK